MQNGTASVGKNQRQKSSTLLEQNKSWWLENAGLNITGKKYMSRLR